MYVLDEIINVINKLIEADNYVNKLSVERHAKSIERIEHLEARLNRMEERLIRGK